jgi:hypothetical protein
MAGRVRLTPRDRACRFTLMRGQNGHAGMKTIWPITLNPTMGRTELMNLADQEPAKAGPGRDRASRPGCLHLRTGPLGQFWGYAHQRLARPRDPDQMAAGACPGTGLSR